jgi:hypothetical protein
MASSSHPNDDHDHDSLFSEASDQEDSNEQSERIELTDETTKVLRTRWDELYELSEDGTTYIRPRFMRGVPVVRMPDSYRNRHWAKLEDYLAKEDEEERLKAEYNDRVASAMAAGPVPKELRDRCKMHKDNVSKHRKIREVFGGTSTMHPNQVLAKGHLPEAGLCEQEVMYMLGCKYTDLAMLSTRGELAMDPWDFLRWRIGRLVEQKLTFPGQSGRRTVRGVIFGISSEKSDDPVFREIILHSARLAGNSGRYGQRKKKNLGVAQEPRPTKLWRSQVSTSSARQPPKATSDDKRAARPMSQQAEAEQRRAERRAAIREQERRRVQSGSGYQGVNAFRQQQQQSQPSLRGGPCGG